MITLLSRAGLAGALALVLAGCAATSGPPSGYHFQSDADGLVSSSERVDPATGMTVTTSTAWHQGAEPIPPLQPAQIAGTWSIAAENGRLACAWSLETYKLVTNLNGQAMRARPAGTCARDFYETVIGWYVHEQTLILTDGNGRAVGTLGAEADGSFAGSVTVLEGRILQVQMRRA